MKPESPIDSLPTVGTLPIDHVPLSYNEHGAYLWVGDPNVSSRPHPSEVERKPAVAIRYFLGLAFCALCCATLLADMNTVEAIGIIAAMVAIAFLAVGIVSESVLVIGYFLGLLVSFLCIAICFIDWSFGVIFSIWNCIISLIF